MRKVAYSLEIEKISKNMKVIWFGTERLTKKDPWRKLAQHAIRVGKSTDVEEMLDKKKGLRYWSRHIQKGCLLCHRCNGW